MSPSVQPRFGGWLPQDPRVIEAWRGKKVAQASKIDRSVRPFHPVIQEFQKLIEGDPTIYMGFNEMFNQIPNGHPYDKDLFGNPQVRDYKTMLSLFDMIISEAPAYRENGELVGIPINVILDWSMGTDAGFNMFINPKVNEQFAKMFNVWAEHLSSPASCSVLTTEPDGWLSPAAQADMGGFTDLFECDPNAPHYGFTSWDNFFTRSFKAGLRPVESPDDDLVITSACESDAYRIAHNVRSFDNFWLKGQQYSLNHMLNNDPLAPQFEGGTVYQAFLSAFNYHRWHTPVNGTIVKIVKVPGTYYASAPTEGFTGSTGGNASILALSQSFITSMAARMLVFIQADSPLIGLMCFIAVGMAEVSSCEATVKEGDAVKKGDQLGMFHFGGSTHCLIFRPETILDFAVEPAPLTVPPPTRPAGVTTNHSLSSLPTHANLGSKIATVRVPGSP